MKARTEFSSQCPSWVVADPKFASANEDKDRVESTDNNSYESNMKEVGSWSTTKS